MVACHLKTDADPDPDPAYHFDADQCFVFGSTSKKNQNKP
jgi:hypothetical protein